MRERALAYRRDLARVTKNISRQHLSIYSLPTHIQIHTTNSEQLLPLTVPLVHRWNDRVGSTHCKGEVSRV